jgi:hypothetical protein
MTKASPPSNAPGGPSHERRRSKRREILSTFSLFVVVPRKGPHRLTVHDLSEDGIGFDLDIEEEADTSSGDGLPAKLQNSKLDVHLYLNQSFYLPLRASIKRVEDRKKTIRRLGAEFTERQDPAYRGLIAFIAMLDAVSEPGVIK